MFDKLRYAPRVYETFLIELSFMRDLKRSFIPKLYELHSILTLAREYIICTDILYTVVFRVRLVSVFMIVRVKYWRRNGIEGFSFVALARPLRL